MTGYLHVRNWDRYQYQLVNATKRRRIAFDIEAALLDPNFKGKGGYARLGAWVKVLAWAARMDNRIPADTKWWREEFSRDGDKTRDRFIALEWLSEANAGVSTDRNESDSSESNAESNVESNVESDSPITEPESDSFLHLCRDSESDSATSKEKEMAPEVEVEVNHKTPSPKAFALDVADNVVNLHPGDTGDTLGGEVFRKILRARGAG